MLRAQLLFLALLAAVLSGCERRVLPPTSASGGGVAPGGSDPGGQDPVDDGNGGGGDDGTGDGSDDGGVDDGFGAIEFCVDGSATPTDTRTALFFTGSLKAVDPRDASNVATITTENVLPERVVALVNADFVPDGGINGAPRLENVQTSQVVYPVGGQLFRVIAQVRDGDVIEATDLEIDLAVDILEIFAGEDFADPCATQLVVTLAGGSYKAVLSDGSGRDFPAKPIAALNDFSTGALQGFLAHEPGGSLFFVAADGTQAELGKFNTVKLLGKSRAVGAFLALGGGDLGEGVGPVLHFLDGEARELRELPYDLGKFAEYKVEPFLDDLLVLGAFETVNVTLDRIDPDGNVASLFSTGVANTALGANLDLDVAQDRVVLAHAQFSTSTFTFNSRILSVLADGTGDVIDLGEGTLASFSSATYRPLLAAEDRVFYSYFPLGATAPNAVAVQTDGVELLNEPGAKWVGHQFDVQSFGASSPSKMYLVSGLTGTQVGGSSLSVLDAETLLETALLGTVPAQVNSLEVPPTQTNAVLARAFVFSETLQVNTRDVLFLDATQPGSLVPVSDTPDKDELIVFPGSLF